MTHHQAGSSISRAELSKRGRAALRYAALSWPVLPLHTPDRDGACSCARRHCPKPGKHPRSRHGLHDASTARAQIQAWWTTWPTANIGVATGRLVVLDVDDPAGRDALAELERTHAPLPTTLTAATGRGRQLYFDAGQHRIRNSAGRLGPGLDVRGHGGIVTVPPSLHVSGHRYQWRIRQRPAPLVRSRLPRAMRPRPPRPPPASSQSVMARRSALGARAASAQT